MAGVSPMFQQGRKGVKRKAVSPVVRKEREDLGWVGVKSKGLYELLSLRQQRETVVCEDWRKTWSRVWARWIPAAVSDTLFRVTRERESRLGMVEDPYCPLEATRLRREGPAPEGGSAPGMLAVGGPIGDWEHNLTLCARVRQLWEWVRMRAMGMLGRRVEDRELLLLRFPAGPGAITAQWLVAHYVQFVHVEGKRGTRLCVRNLRAFLAASLERARREGEGALIQSDFLDYG